MSTYYTPNSSIVASVSYDKATQALDVELTGDRGTYRYFEINETYWNYLLDYIAEGLSVGQLYNRLKSMGLQFIKLVTPSPMTVLTVYTPKSKIVASFSYDAKVSTLDVKLVTGDVHRFFNVTELYWHYLTDILATGHPADDSYRYLTIYNLSSKYATAEALALSS